MVFCTICGSSFDPIKSPICPICGGGRIKQNVLPNHISHQCGATCGGNCGCNAPDSKNIDEIGEQVFGNPIQNIAHPNDAIDPMENYGDIQQYTPKLEIVCTKCGVKNPRTLNYCKNCLNPLPLTSDDEDEDHYSKMVKVMDKRAREAFYLTGVRLFLIAMLSKLKRFDFLSRHTCGEIHKTGCKQLLTPMDDDCPACGAPYLRYACRCGYPLSTSDIRCPKCNADTQFQNILEVLKNGGEGQGADQIVNYLQNIFGKQLRVRTYASILPQATIFKCKKETGKRASIAIEYCELLARHLRDSSGKQNTMELPDAFSSQFKSPWMDEGIGLNVGEPIQDDSIKELLKQKSADAAANSESTASDDDDDDDFPYDDYKI